MEIKYHYEDGKNPRIIVLEDDDHFQRWLIKQGIQSLKKMDGSSEGEVDIFRQLKSGASYQPGPELTLVPHATGKQQQDSTNRKMAEVLLNWKKTQADLFGRKRKREIETTAEVGDNTQRKRLVAADGDTTKTANTTSIGEEAKVETISPICNGSWYLGLGDNPLYIRQCLRDVGTVILQHILHAEKRKRAAILYVISGASGIGKSWSINAFVAELLNNDLKVFFHSGSLGCAWMFSNDGPMEPINPTDITFNEDPDVVYVYDSPGLKRNMGEHTQAKLRLNIGVTLIFSSPKIENYQFAESKSNGFTQVMNLPTWTNQEMLSVNTSKNSDAVNTCYSLWGGNMRAYDKFMETYTEFGAKQAKQRAESQLLAQINCIDKLMAEKMSWNLEKQLVQEKFNSEALRDSPGHILVPEPLVTDPSEPLCFEDFYWRFCSPLAEKMFWDQVKTMGKDTVMKLLKSVFQVPSPNGVLFEKAAHFLITNGVVQKFRWYSYSSPGELEEYIKFPQCKIVPFETDNLQDTFKTVLNNLKYLQPEDGTKVAIALEPKAVSFDAVDMLVLVKERGTGSEKDWCLYLLQDMIARKHSLHPVKVLWYCALFCKAFNEVVLSSAPKESILKCCKYVPVVPQEMKGKFAFEEPVSNSPWAEVEQVATLLNVTWPDGFPVKKTYLKTLAEKTGLKIPPTASGSVRQLSKDVVGGAWLLEEATAKVTQQCHVIFDVFNA
ncbi:hypothetical protein IV203_007813 [Nitzschia inconspicua]|uniref:Uncharacterized protein n=1 Tax=Nitzschia inconspicua TaxID=303405 RepID=A0A9K3KZ45_9STRA|nr:hypothetical protein IV203_007813 [Nitzschia inconspicua]